MLLVPLLLLGLLLRCTGSWIPSIALIAVILGDIFVVSPLLLGGDCNNIQGPFDLSFLKTAELYVDDDIDVCDERECLFPMLTGQVQRVGKTIGGNEYLFYWSDAPCDVTQPDRPLVPKDIKWPIRMGNECVKARVLSGQEFSYRAKITRYTEHFGAREVAEHTIEKRAETGWLTVYKYRSVIQHVITPFAHLVFDTDTVQCRYPLAP